VWDRRPSLFDEEWSWPARVLFPYAVSSNDEQRGCAKPTRAEACLAPKASWKRSECKTHQGSKKSPGTWRKEKRTRAYNRRCVAEQGWAGCDQTSLLSHSCGTTPPCFTLTLSYLMLAASALSREGEVAHPEVDCNGLLPSLMLKRWGVACRI
jgi:hypothetical protein